MPGVDEAPQTSGKALEFRGAHSDLISEAMHWASRLAAGEIGGADRYQVWS